jgi:hypothetical protein
MQPALHKLRDRLFTVYSVTQFLLVVPVFRRKSFQGGLIFVCDVSQGRA